MSEFTTTSRSIVDSWNQRLLTIGTDAELIALPEYFSGMLVFCTSTGAAFTINKLYQRNAANDGWLEIVDFSSIQTLTNKSISGATNTFSNIGTAALSNGAITGIKFSETLHVVGTAAVSTAFSTTSTTYVDITSMTVTITAKGNRAGINSEFFTSVALDGAATLDVAVTDGSDTVKSETRWERTTGAPCKEEGMIWPSYEAAPSAGSFTRKARMKVSASTGRCNAQALTNGSRFLIVEII